MGTTFQNIYEDIRTRAKQKSSNDSIAKGFVNDHYKRIANKREWRWLYKIGYPLSATAKYETGTVSVTEGSSTVTGASTIWTSAMVGRKFKLTGFDEVYNILSINTGTQTLVLGRHSTESEFNGDTETGASYTIFEDEISLPSDCDYIINLKQYRSPKRLDYVAGIRKSNTDKMFYNNNDPLSWTYGEYDSSGYKTIVLNPNPYRDVLLELDYKKLITELSEDADEPLIPEQYRYLLKMFGYAEMLKYLDDQRYAGELQRAEYDLNIWMKKESVYDDKFKFVPAINRSRGKSLTTITNEYYLGDLIKKL